MKTTAKIQKNTPRAGPSETHLAHSLIHTVSTAIAMSHYPLQVTLPAAAAVDRAG